jgi:hypothetical protein
VGTLEASEGRAGKVVIAARQHRGQPLAEAGERERVIAHRTDIVRRLPETPALDARARVQRVDDAPPEDVFCDGRRGDEEAPLEMAPDLRTRRPPSRRRGAGTEARPDGTEPLGSSRGRPAAPPEAGTRDTWLTRAGDRQAAAHRARR